MALLPATPGRRITVIGIGNDWRGDDAAGLLVARLLKESAPSRMTVRETRGDAAALLQAWQGGEVVIVVDAVASGGLPGQIHRFEVHGSEITLPLATSCSTHAWGLAQALALGEALQELPARLIIYGVEGKNFDFGRELTPAVKEAIPEAARRIRAEVEKLQERTRHDDNPNLFLQG